MKSLQLKPTNKGYTLNQNKQTGIKEMMQYYFRRGNKFFFRSLSTYNKFTIIVSDDIIESTRKQLQFKQKYLIYVC